MHLICTTRINLNLDSSLSGFICVDYRITNCFRLNAYGFAVYFVVSCLLVDWWALNTVDMTTYAALTFSFEFVFLEKTVYMCVTKNKWLISAPPELWRQLIDAPCLSCRSTSQMFISFIFRSQAGWLERAFNTCIHLAIHKRHWMVI